MNARTTLITVCFLMIAVLAACAQTNVASNSFSSTACTIYGRWPITAPYKTGNCKLIVEDNNTLHLATPGPTILFKRVVPSPQNQSINGLWMAYGYDCPDGSGGTEQISIQQTGASYVATKSTGDSCIPAGHVTFYGTVPDQFLTSSNSASAVAQSNSNTSTDAGTCLKGKLTKKVSGVSPKCPTGYKLK